MKMIKIKYEDAAYILGYIKVHYGEKYFCNWYLENKYDNCGDMRMDIKWWFYILTFIPVHIIKMVVCLWNGGLKKFSIDSRNTRYDTVIGWPDADSSSQFGRFKEIWDKYESN